MAASIWEKVISILIILTVHIVVPHSGHYTGYLVSSYIVRRPQKYKEISTIFLTILSNLD